MNSRTTTLPCGESLPSSSTARSCRRCWRVVIEEDNDERQQLLGERLRRCGRVPGHDQRLGREMITQQRHSPMVSLVYCALFDEPRSSRRRRLNPAPPRRFRDDTWLVRWPGIAAIPSPSATLRSTSAVIGRLILRSPSDKSTGSHSWSRHQLTSTESSCQSTASSPAIGNPRPHLLFKLFIYSEAEVGDSTTSRAEASATLRDFLARSLAPPAARSYWRGRFSETGSLTGCCCAMGTGRSSLTLGILPPR